MNDFRGLVNVPREQDSDDRFTYRLAGSRLRRSRVLPLKANTCGCFETRSGTGVSKGEQWINFGCKRVPINRVSKGARFGDCPQCTASGLAAWETGGVSCVPRGMFTFVFTYRFWLIPRPPNNGPGFRVSRAWEDVEQAHVPPLSTYRP